MDEGKINRRRFFEVAAGAAVAAGAVGEATAKHGPPAGWVDTIVSKESDAMYAELRGGEIEKRLKKLQVQFIADLSRAENPFRQKKLDKIVLPEKTIEIVERYLDDVAATAGLEERNSADDSWVISYAYHDASRNSNDPTYMLLRYLYVVSFARNTDELKELKKARQSESNQTVGGSGEDV